MEVETDDGDEAIPISDPIPVDKKKRGRKPKEPATLNPPEELNEEEDRETLEPVVETAASSGVEEKKRGRKPKALQSAEPHLVIEETEASSKEVGKRGRKAKDPGSKSEKQGRDFFFLLRLLVPKFPVLYYYFILHLNILSYILFYLFYYCFNYSDAVKNATELSNHGDEVAPDPLPVDKKKRGRKPKEPTVINLPEELDEEEEEREAPEPVVETATSSGVEEKKRGRKQKVFKSGEPNLVIEEETKAVS